jgi:MoxR-like ATPase
MPADITGTNIYDMNSGKFNFMPGPIFTTFLVADEINRSPAKTQAALLQAMQERIVTIDRASYSLPPNFTVFATQNPIEFEGTYPLPEAQKDRFMFKITMQCPNRDDELLLARKTLTADSPENLLKNGAVQPVVTAEKLVELRQALEKVAVRDELMGYGVDLIRATREHQSVLSGAGPRATQCLVLAGRAYAAMQDRDFVTPDDLRAVALPVLEHRINLRPEYEIEGLTTIEVVNKILGEVPVPK